MNTNPEPCGTSSEHPGPMNEQVLNRNATRDLAPGGKMNWTRRWAVVVGVIWMTMSVLAEEKIPVAPQPTLKRFCLAIRSIAGCWGLIRSRDSITSAWIQKARVARSPTCWPLPSASHGLAAGGPATHWQQAEPGTWTCVVSGAETGSSVTWSVTRSGDDLVWSFLYQGDKPASDLSVSLPFNALMGAAVLIPAKLDSQSRGVGPWLARGARFRSSARRGGTAGRMACRQQWQAWRRPKRAKHGR